MGSSGFSKYCPLRLGKSLSVDSMLIPVKVVLQPEDRPTENTSHNYSAVRILCKVKPPVNGLRIKEHIEVSNLSKNFLDFRSKKLNFRFKLNMKPMNLQVTNKFYKKIRQFFFPDMQHDGTMQSTAHPSGSVTGKNSGPLSDSVPVCSCTGIPDRYGPDFINKLKMIHFLILRAQIQLDPNS